MEKQFSKVNTAFCSLLGRHNSLGKDLAYDNIVKLAKELKKHNKISAKQFE